MDLAKAGSNLVVNYAGSEDKAKAVVEECKAAGAGGEIETKKTC